MRFYLLRFNALALCATITLTAPGCSRSPYELAPVHGTVTIDGRPLSQAKVMFAPVEVGDNPNPGKPAFGLIQDDGKFVLTTYEKNDGAVVGEHWISIVKLSTKAPGTTLVRPPTSNGPEFNRLSLPQKVKVLTDMDNEIDLKLTSQDVARYGVVVRD